MAKTLLIYFCSGLLLTTVLCYFADYNTVNGTMVGMGTAGLTSLPQVKKHLNNRT